MLKNNLKHEIDFIIKNNEILDDHTINNDIGQLLSQYEHGRDIRKHRKQ